MTPLERRRAAETGQLTLGEMLQWASRRPVEVPLVDGEFFFVSAFRADSCEVSGDTSRSGAAAAGDTSSHRSR